MATRASRSKEAILAAAFKLFARDGFDGASLPKIAKAAGVSHPSILYHFQSKDNLWRQTVHFAFGPLMRDAAQLDTGSSEMLPLEKLKVIVRAFAHFAARNPDHFALIMSEAGADSERLRWLRETYADAFLSKLEDILRAAQQSKQIRPIPVGHLSFILMGGVVLFFSFNFHLPTDADLDALADRHADFLIEILLDGLRI